jgi:hypothetical protein
VGTDSIKEISYLLFDVAVVSDFAERLGEGNDASARVANRHHANLAQLHATVGLPRPSLAYPDGMLSREPIWLRLIEAIEAPEGSPVLILNLAAMSIEQRQRRAVAVPDFAVAIGDQDRFGEGIKR